MTDLTLNRYISSGTSTQRIAFTPVQATPASGPNPSAIWFETDTGDTYMWNFGGSIWTKIDIGAGGGGSNYKGYSPSSVHNGASPSAGFWSGVSIIMDEACTLTALSFLATVASASTVSIANVYADTGMKVDGGARLSTSATITGVTLGINKITLSTPITVTRGQIVWAGLTWTVASPTVAAGNAVSAFFSTSGSPNPAPAASYAGNNLAIWLEK